MIVLLVIVLGFLACFAITLSISRYAVKEGISSRENVDIGWLFLLSIFWPFTLAASVCIILSEVIKHFLLKGLDGK